MLVLFLWPKVSPEQSDGHSSMPKFAQLRRIFKILLSVILQGIRKSEWSALRSLQIVSSKGSIFSFNANTQGPCGTWFLCFQWIFLKCSPQSTIYFYTNHPNILAFLRNSAIVIGSLQRRGLWWVLLCFVCVVLVIYKTIQMYVLLIFVVCIVGGLHRNRFVLMIYSLIRRYAVFEFKIYLFIFFVNSQT